MSLRCFFSFLEQRRPDIQALPESYQSLQRAIDRLANITYEEVEELGLCSAIPIITSVLTIARVPR